MKMKQYNLVIDEKLIDEVDRFIRKRGLFHSRSDFVRDAIRSRLIEIKKVVFEEEAAARHEHDHPDEETSKEAMEALLKAHDEKKFTGVH